MREAIDGKEAASPAFFDVVWGGLVFHAANSHLTSMALPSDFGIVFSLAAYLPGIAAAMLCGIGPRRCQDSSESTNASWASR